MAIQEVYSSISTKIPLLLLSIVLSLLLLASLNDGGTFVNCDLIISTDTTWSTDQTIDGDLIIEKNILLQIDPGVTISLNHDKSVIVNGLLKALGTREHPIVLNCTEQNKRWSRIQFTSDSLPSVIDAEGNYSGQTILKHVIISNAYEDYSIEFQNPAAYDRRRKFYMEGVQVVQSGGIRAWDVGLYLKDCHLTGPLQSYDNAIKLISSQAQYDGFSYLSAKNSVFEQYRSGFYYEYCPYSSVSQVTGCTFKSIGSRIAIETSCNTTIESNYFYSSRIEVVMPAGYFKIANNHFEYCTAETISLRQALPQHFHIEGNSFKNCYMEASATQQQQQLIVPPSWLAPYQLDIVNNVFDHITTSDPTAEYTLLNINSAKTLANIIGNEFKHIQFGRRQRDDQKEALEDNVLITVQNARNTRIMNNTFNNPDTPRAFMVTSLFETYPVLDARFNYWLDAQNSTDIRTKAIDFLSDSTKSYISMFPAFIGSEKKLVHLDSSDRDDIIVKDTTWSGVITASNITIVEAGAKLIIEPGTTVHIPNKGSIAILGEVRARGTKRSMIKFTGATAGDVWNSIFLAPSVPGSTITADDMYQDGSILEYVQIENNENTKRPMIDITMSSTLFMSHMKVISTKQQQGEDIPCIIAKPPSYDPNLHVVIRDSKFKQCSIGLAIDGNHGSILTGYDNTFEHNTIGIACGNSKCNLKSGIFEENSMAVIGMDLNLEGNQFMNNRDTAIVSKGGLNLKNNKFLKNNVDIDLSGTGQYDYDWKDNIFSEPTQHFFTTYDNQHPRHFSLSGNAFLKGKCSLRSQTAIDLSSIDMNFERNNVTDCQCELGDVLRLSATGKATVQYNKFERNAAHKAPSSRSNPSIFTAKDANTDFKYNTFSSDNVASLLFYRESPSTNNLDVALNYWGLQHPSDVRDKIDASFTKANVIFTPYFLSDDVSDVSSKNLRCQEGYEPSGLTCVPQVPPPGPPTPEPEVWNPVFVLVMSFLLLGVGGLVIGSIVGFALYIARRRARSSRRRLSEAGRQGDANCSIEQQQKLKLHGTIQSNRDKNNCFLEKSGTATTKKKNTTDTTLKNTINNTILIFTFLRTNN